MAALSETAPALVRSGDGEFMDGCTALVHRARVELDNECLRISTASDAARIEWPLSSITLDETQEGVAHVHSSAQPFAMLALRDAELITALRARTGRVQRLPGGGKRVRYAAACTLAIVALAGSFYWSVPGLSRWVAKRVPLEYERELGQNLLPLLESEYCDSPEATRALSELKRRLDPDGEISAELHVMRADVVNAFALPGGDVVLTTGLCAAAQTPEEVAGVLAHELEHVRQRHVMSHMVRASLLTAAWSVAVGDYAGFMLLDPATAFEIINLRHSRADEAQADAGAGRMLDRAGISRQGLIDFFERIREETDVVPEWLSNHPASAQRAAELGAHRGATEGAALLDPELLEALRRCQ